MIKKNKFSLFISIVISAWKGYWWFRKYSKTKNKSRRIKDAIEWGKANANEDYDMSIAILKRWLQK